jgi:hypothetical protein
MFTIALQGKKKLNKTGDQELQICLLIDLMFCVVGDIKIP